jgi:hypothetical protein
MVRWYVPVLFGCINFIVYYVDYNNKISYS